MPAQHVGQNNMAHSIGYKLLDLSKGCASELHVMLAQRMGQDCEITAKHVGQDCKMPAQHVDQNNIDDLLDALIAAPPYGPSCVNSRLNQAQEHGPR